MKDRQGARWIVGLILGAGLCVSGVSATVSDLPFLQTPPKYSQAPEFMGGARGWIAYDHVWNQSQTPGLAHRLDTGTILTLYDSPSFALCATGREVFRFMQNPYGDWLLWARDLVSDLRLQLWAPLGPGNVDLGYRHDCKHDLETFYGRTAVHDAFVSGWSVPYRLCALPGNRQNNGWFGTVNVEGEVDLPHLFQSQSDEPDLGMIGLDNELRLKIGQSVLEPWLRTRVSMQFLDTNSSVKQAGGIAVDGRISLGFSVRGKAGSLDVSLSAERLSDPWFNNEPESCEPIFLQVMLHADGQ